MIRIEDGKLFYTRIGENETELGTVKDGSLVEGWFRLGNEGFPVERFPEIQTEWDKYPHPEPMIEPTIPKPTIQEQLDSQSQAIMFLMEVLG